MVDSTAKRIETAIGSEPEGKIVFSTDYAELGTPECHQELLPLLPVFLQHHAV